MVELEIMKANEANVHGTVYTDKGILDSITNFHHTSARPIIRKLRNGSDHEMAFITKNDLTYDPVSKILKVKIPDAIASMCRGSYASPIILVDKEVTVKDTKVIDAFRIKSILLSEESNAFKGLKSRIP